MLMKRIISVTLAVICILLLTPALIGSAVSELSSLTVVMKYGETPLQGLNIEVCRVADAVESETGVGPAGGGVVYVKAAVFSGMELESFDLSTDEKNIELAAALYAFAGANKITLDRKVINGEGKAVYTDLLPGIYLVAQADAEDSDYIIDPYLVYVPDFSTESMRDWNRNVIAYPKTEPVPRSSKPVTVSAGKVWAGTGSHPASVQAQLYRNGKAEGAPVTLNSENNWSCKWEDLDPADTWTVDEINVPEGYTKTVSGNVSNGFVIINTKNPPPETTRGPDGPKTGDYSNMSLWILLLSLGFLGLFTLVCAVKKSRSERVMKKMK